VPLANVLSVVIVSFNARDELGRCLQSLLQHLTGKYEVIVVDNGSPDGSADLVAQDFPDSRLIRNRSNIGFAAAADIGADAAAGDVIVFLNPDCELSDDAFSAAAAHLRQNPDVGALGVKLLDPDGRLQLSARRFPSLGTALFNRYSLPTRLFPRNPFSRRYLMTDWDHARLQPVDWVSGACLMTTRAVLDRVGSFDEAFFWGFEDVDFCQRLRREGLSVVYYPEASVTHAIGASARSVPVRAVVARHRGMWRYYKRYLASNAAVNGLAFVAVWARCGLQVLATVRRRSAKAHR
jgi:GT2 family glycosyltransferase